MSKWIDIEVEVGRGTAFKIVQELNGKRRLRRDE